MLRLLGLAAGIAIVAALLKRLAAQDVLMEELLRLTRLGRAKSLVENVEKVRTGATEMEVESIAGKPDSASRDSWVYFADEHSGYAVYFDAGRVESVLAWFS
jgi:hypothetical protein